MIKTIKTKISRWKVAVMVPSVAGVLAFVACQDQVMNDLNTVAENSSMALNVPRPVQDRYDALSKANPGVRYIIMEVQEDGQEKLINLAEQYGSPTSFQFLNSAGTPLNRQLIQVEVEGRPVVVNATQHEGERTFAIIEFNQQVQALSQKPTQDGDVFLVVEETAHPDGGMEKFYGFVKDNMSYPSQARQDSIEGRVFIEFIVEKDGSLTNFKSLKGIGHGCDDEAIRVLTLSPPWIPGRQKGEPVRQKMVLPVVFHL